MFKSFTLLGAGGLCLVAALTAEPAELGVVEPNFTAPVIVAKLLGVGATSSVFEAQYNGSTITIYSFYFLLRLCCSRKKWDS